MIPLTHAQLLLLKQDRRLLEAALGLNPSAMLIDPLYIKEIDDAFDNFWLPNTLSFPDKYLWYTGWEIVLKSSNTVIGGMGFAGYPNSDGEAEIGYMIDANQHNKGYATEALQLLSQWAFTHEFVKAIIVNTYADNLPSKRILDKCGFSLMREAEGLLTYRLKKNQ
ncbi:GNAT family N-acetyltransferase [Mucilaginibacter sp. cycad4]|uniref:GNAT family N-acetyltransferase n=1 Tax=Mucilaginibacter sp. cycad4 TaxID=3342096 RepID=UPI002AABC747|nr:GNAT family N-acetyltransferase [Mucilaginibacter gossypii]WPV00019.1 GNAT family N-acetyltransferase [Mucilaginibacter gossypii]